MPVGYYSGDDDSQLDPEGWLERNRGSRSVVVRSESRMTARPVAVTRRVPGELTAAGRNRIGEAHRGEFASTAKLTEEKVRDIRVRLARKETQISIAKLYGVTLRNIAYIAAGKTWRHVV